MISKSFPSALKTSGAIFDIAGKQARLAQLEKILLKPDFWEKPEEGKNVLKERADLSEIIQTWQQLMAELEESELLLSLAVE
ncbi:MAG TPA: peptide chain release factor 2, partial [Syntrophobacteraceae bacterium]|nr:peptide chain release factor 2 [Syntrophobacteraceae bacterium]